MQRLLIRLHLFEWECQYHLQKGLEEELMMALQFSGTRTIQVAHSSSDPGNGQT
jgi:hypothetical protein